tara:strand:- start:693 stop:1250 length:558 start_codon:yes stop_codon:yes gene_type:complete
VSKSKIFSDTSANRYSLALYELASESGQLDDVEKNSDSLKNLMLKNEELKLLIKNPTIKKDDLQLIVNKIAEQYKLNNLMIKFLSFLILKRRFFFVERILKDFLETCSKKRGEVKAELTSAKELSENEINNIKKELEKNFSAQIKLNYKNDSSLIGGLIVKVGSTMVDTSIKNKLQKIENRMIEA